MKQTSSSRKKRTDKIKLAYKARRFCGVRVSDKQREVRIIRTGRRAAPYGVTLYHKITGHRVRFGLSKDGARILVNSLKAMLLGHTKRWTEKNWEVVP